MTELSEAPDLYDIPADPEERSRFRIDDDGKAAWAMRKARDIQRRRREIHAIAQAEIERIQAWAADEDDRLDPDYIYFRELLRDYALRLRAADENRKSIRTPYGTVCTRTVGGAWEVDEATVIEWARSERPELVQVKESFPLSAAKRVLTSADGKAIDSETGAVVPGITIQPAKVTTTLDIDLDAS